MLLWVWRLLLVRLLLLLLLLREGGRHEHCILVLLILHVIILIVPAIVNGLGLWMGIRLLAIEPRPLAWGHGTSICHNFIIPIRSPYLTSHITVDIISDYRSRWLLVVSSSCRR